MKKTSIIILVMILLGIVGVIVFLIIGKPLMEDPRSQLFGPIYHFLLLIVLGGGVSLIYKEYLRERKIEEERRTRLRDMHSDLLSAYNKTKKVRRLFRARAIFFKDSPKTKYILAKEYDAQFQDLIDAQLIFETYAKRAKSKELWFKDGEKLKEPLDRIEGYLNEIIKEYGIQRKNFEGDPPCKKLSDLDKFKEFIGPTKNAPNFVNDLKNAMLEVFAALEKTMLQ